MLLALQGRFSESGDLITAPLLATLVIFAIGCAVGLLSFSKLLRWLLARHESQTMAVLCGFMFGSLRKIWPFKQDLTPDVANRNLKQFENFLPAELSSEVVLSIALVVAGAAFVFAKDRFPGLKILSALKSNALELQNRRSIDIKRSCNIPGKSGCKKPVPCMQRIFRLPDPGKHDLL